MIANWIKRLTASLGLAIATAGAQQQPPEPGEPPLVVESREMVITEPSGQAVYRGDVVATKGEMVLRCRRLVVEYGDGGLKRAHAYGDPVVLDRGPRHGEAQEAIYDQGTDSLLLIGNARLQEGANTVRGHRIHYFLADQRTEVYGRDEGPEEGSEDGRARAVFDPDNPPSKPEEGTGPGESQAEGDEDGEAAP
jgi:lipopolysaccharide export system protein LptA